MLLTLVSFVVVIGIIVTIHEFGHYLAARLCGMRVLKFSIGFPPKIVSWRSGQTDFQICWIPLGGFVQIAGMVDESLDGASITGAPDEFMSKSPLARVFTLSAGVMMNYVVAFLIIIGITLVIGIPSLNKAVIGEVMPEMPAMEAGLARGDEIRAVDGVAVRTWEEVVRQITGSADTVALTIWHPNTRSEREYRLPTIEKEIEDGVKRKVIGIGAQFVHEPASGLQAITAGWNFCSRTTVGIVMFLGDLFRGKGNLSDLAGPVGVAKMSGESARQGSGQFLFFLAYVSVSIGFLNILPFPVLDGGHIVYVLIEAVIRRPIPTRIKLHIQQAGMAFLLLLALFVSYNDIVRIMAD